MYTSSIFDGTPRMTAGHTSLKRRSIAAMPDNRDMQLANRFSEQTRHINVHQSGEPALLMLNKQCIYASSRPVTKNHVSITTRSMTTLA